MICGLSKLDKVLLAKADKRYRASRVSHTDTQSYGVCVSVSDWGWQRRKSTIKAGPSCAARGRWSEQSTSLTALDVYSVLPTPLEHPHPPTLTAHIQSRQGSEWSEPQYRCRVTKETHLLYAISVNSQWLWLSRVCSFLLHLASCFMN